MYLKFVYLLFFNLLSLVVRRQFCFQFSFFPFSFSTMNSLKVRIIVITTYEHIRAQTDLFWIKFLIGARFIGQDIIKQNFFLDNEMRSLKRWIDEKVLIVSRI